MSITKTEIEGFFANYAKALSARDIKEIVGCWGVPALVLSDEAAIGVAKVEEIAAFFASSMSQYEGVAAARPTINSIMALSENVAGCQIAWDHQDEAGKSVGGEAGYYMLKRDGGALHIHVYTPSMAR